MSTVQLKISALASKIIATMCLTVIIILLPQFSFAAKAQEVATPMPDLVVASGTTDTQATVPTVPTVPTIPTVPTGTATETPTQTPTATPTATPGPLTLDVQPALAAKKIAYKVTFTNNTNLIIHNGKAYFTVPPYTTFNFTESDPGWQCPNGITAGNICEFVWGDIAPTALRQANFVLNVLIDQLPPGANSVTFDIFVVDENGTLFATYHADTPLPNRPTAEDPVAEPIRRLIFLPLLYH